MTESTKQQIDPYLCTCGPCKRFWKSTFHSSADYLLRSEEDRSGDSATLGRLKPQALVSIGDRVMVHGQSGVVKFVGFLDEYTVAPHLMVGVKLDEKVSLGHDGTFSGKRYFYCTKGHGILVPSKDVAPLKAPNKRPPVKGNSMFPSWPEICKRRKQREAMIEESHRKNSNSPPLGSSVRTPRPPTISPRGNRTQLLRQDTSCGRSSEPYLIIQNDPHDVACRDQKQRKKKEAQAASMPRKESAEVSWEKGLMQQWRRKYDDPEKASRMGETLLKLCSAYKEGFKYRDVHAD